MFPGGPTYQGAAHLSRLFNQIALYLTRDAGRAFLSSHGETTVGDRFDAAVPREAESTGSGGVDDPGASGQRRRQWIPGDADDAALPQSPPEAA